jgi:hypothetical protein
VKSPFGVAFADLDRESVSDFLRSAGDETLTWEAKGHKVHADHIHIAASAFGNSILGGYLILGAERDALGVWQLAGIDVGTELGAWISDVLRRVDPAPAYSVSGPWSINAARAAAVIAFLPSTIPPVLTPRGDVYERLVGVSSRVTDRQSLARLFERGQRARDRAEATADAAAQRAIDEARFGHERAKAGFALALSPTGGPDDRAARLFTASFEALLERSTRELSSRDSISARIHGQPFQDRFESWAGDQDGFAIAAYWDGSVSVAYRLSDRGPALDYVLSAGLPEHMWSTAARLAAAMDGFGPTFLTVVGRAKETQNRPITVRRWVDPGEPDASVLASIRREFERATGRRSLESDP